MIKFLCTLVFAAVLGAPVAVAVYAAMTGLAGVAAIAAASAAGACVGIWNPLEK